MPAELRAVRVTEEGLRMSSQAESARSARFAGGRTGYALSRNKAIQIVRNEDFVTVSLFVVVGLLVSACLALLLDIPEVEGLLQMPL
jgi:hypothetical protein